MVQTRTIIVKGLEVSYKDVNEQDYISLLDIAKWKNPEFPSNVVQNWLRTRGAVEYLGLWETIENSNFNYLEFEVIERQAGKPSFVMTPKKWVESTNAIGIISKQGRYSEAWAHRDIAFKFASWLSVELELYIVKEFQRLKIAEQKQIEWSAKRELAKINYHLQTSAIAENLIVPTLTEKQKENIYADEGDLLNVALFGMTAKEWRDKNSDKDHTKENMRDFASMPQLLVLSHMESLNAELIRQKISQRTRLEILNRTAKDQLTNVAKAEKRISLPK